MGEKYTEDLTLPGHLIRQYISDVPPDTPMILPASDDYFDSPILYHYGDGIPFVKGAIEVESINTDPEKIVSDNSGHIAVMLTYLKDVPSGTATPCAVADLRHIPDGYVIDEASINTDEVLDTDDGFGYYDPIVLEDINVLAYATATNGETSIHGRKELFDALRYLMEFTDSVIGQDSALSTNESDESDETSSLEDTGRQEKSPDNKKGTALNSLINFFTRNY